MRSRRAKKTGAGVHRRPFLESTRSRELSLGLCLALAALVGDYRGGCADCGGRGNPIFGCGCRARAGVGRLDHTGRFRNTGARAAIGPTVVATDVIRTVFLVVGVAGAFGTADAGIVDLSALGLADAGSAFSVRGRTTEVVAVAARVQCAGGAVAAEPG